MAWHPELPRMQHFPADEVVCYGLPVEDLVEFELREAVNVFGNAFLCDLPEKSTYAGKFSVFLWVEI